MSKPRAWKRITPPLAVLVTLVPLAVAAAGPAAPPPAPPSAPQGPVLSLQDCVGIALQNSRELAIREQEQEQAGDAVTEAWGAFLPNLNLSRTWQRASRTDFEVPQYDYMLHRLVDTMGDTLIIPEQGDVSQFGDEIVNSTYRDYRATSTINLFNGGAKFSSLNSARAGLKAARASAGYSGALVVQAVSAAYYDLLRYQALLKVARETRDLAAGELERSETYFRLGSAAKSDVLQARVRLENTRLEVVRAENAVAQAFAQLAHAMGRPLAEPFEIDDSALHTDFAVADLETLYASSLSGRLDLQAQALTASARRSDVWTASAGLWPQLNVQASYTRYNNESPYRFGSQESENFSIAASISWDVFNRFTNWTRRAQARATARIAEYQLEQARLDAQLEVRQLYNAVIEARERAAVSRETIVQAQEDLRLAQERFRVGAGTSLERITAEVNLATARADEIQAICDFLIGKVQLDRATGHLVTLSGNG